jgi:hypothetical protein
MYIQDLHIEQHDMLLLAKCKLLPVMLHLQMLRDYHHAAPWLNLEWLNMALNELYSQRPSLFRHVKQQQ